MSIAQIGNAMLQQAAPWKHLKNPGEEANQSFSTLGFCWRLCRTLAIGMQPFLPSSSQKLWENLGYSSKIEDVKWDEALNWDAPLCWNDAQPTPLFQQLDLDQILEDEQGLIESNEEEMSPTHTIKGGKKQKQGEKMKIEGVEFLNFDTFMSVDLRVGTITSVEDHPNADRLFVVTIQESTDSVRTICAGLKSYYTAEEMVEKQIVFVANLEPRPLRGVVSEGMMLAADDGEGNVRLITIDGTIQNGSRVR